NYTPHTINIYSQEQVEYVPEIRKYVVKEGEEPIVVIPSDGMLSAKIKYEKITEIDGIPIHEPVVENCDEPPEGEDVIVSQLYVAAMRALGMDTSKLYTVSQPVYNSKDNPRPVGCLGLNRTK
ncbi:hypothetical protein J7M00_04760, partial [bacterium]|nr:hypothetical protein [bacterium]